MFEPEDRDGHKGFRFEAVGTIKPLLEGAVPGCLKGVAALKCESWNRLMGWLMEMEKLRTRAS